MTAAAPSTVCILDSDTDVCAMIVDVLEEAGYRAMHGPLDAGGIASVAQTRPAVIILEMDPRRLELSEHILAQLHHQLQPTPPIVLSSTDARLLTTLSADGCAQRFWLLPRPFSYDELLAVVAAAIDTTQGLNERIVCGEDGRTPDNTPSS